MQISFTKFLKVGVVLLEIGFMSTLKHMKHFPSELQHEL